MSSSRFPGKVLAPLKGRPLVSYVLERVAEAVPHDRVVLLTSDEPSDDPLALYVEALGFAVFRGPLDDVVERFRLCLEAHPTDWFFRVSGDSPLLDARVLEELEAAARDGVDLVTNLFPRSFPKGQSAELVRTERFLTVAHEELTPAQREHVTLVYYDEPDRFAIVNVSAPPAARGGPDVVVDTIEDLRRLEALLD